MASLHLLSPPSKFCSSLVPLSRHYTYCIPSLTSLGFTTSIKPFLSKSVVVRFALADTESDSTKSLEPDTQALLQEVADTFDLPPDYFAQLPSDLRLDLNDAAFDLSTGPVLDECGQELGETLLNLSKAWELADTSTSHSLASKLPLLGGNLADNAKSAFGKRLASALGRFLSMGQYGQGEPQKAFALLAGRVLSSSSTSTVTDKQTKEETRTLKFGELQIEVTPYKAIVGALIGFVFGLLSWVIAQGIQSIPESSLQYANDNALLLAKSLRGALLVLFYSSTFLSGFTAVGLVLLGIQLKSKEN